MTSVIRWFDGRKTYLATFVATLVALNEAQQHSLFSAEIEKYVIAASILLFGVGIRSAIEKIRQDIATGER